MTAAPVRRKLTLRKKICFSLVALTLGGLLLVLVGEIVFRIRGVALTARIQAALGDSTQAPGWAVFDSDLHYRNRPDWNDHNSHGMRDDPVGAKEGFRLLILGDSIGYQGDSIEDTYPGQLEALLNEDESLVDCEVLNASTKGYTNYQELEYFKKYGVDFEPDLVAIAFCVNDLHTFLHQFDVIDGEIVANTYAFSSDAGGSSAPRWIAPSLFLTWTWHKSRAALTRMGLRSGTIFECRPDISPAWRDESWPALESQVSEIAALCRERDIKLFLFAFPHAEQYRPEYLQDNRPYVLKPQSQLAEICNQASIPYLDLYEHLDASSLIWDGIHLTSEGRTRSAQAVKDFLSAHELVPVKDNN